MLGAMARNDGGPGSQAASSVSGIRSPCRPIADLTMTVD
jgi:hypothetical protein